MLHPAASPAPAAYPSSSLKEKQMATKKKCHTFKVKHKTRGGKLLPKSQWKEITRCEGRKFKVGKRCHAGGPNWKKQIPKHTKSFAKLAPATFVPCK
jgi:hypothetical protein